jgi:quinol monooxygenase YgiN
MSVFVLVEGRTRPETTEPLKALVKELFVETRVYDGCQEVTLKINQDDPESFLLVEYWESKAHYEKYLGWRQETGVLGNIISMLDGDPSIRYFDTTDA